MPNPATISSAAPFAVPPERKVDQFLSDAGDGTGVTEMIGDYSVTPEEFRIDATAGQYTYIERMIIYIRGNGTFAATLYGPLSELPNGLQLRAHDPDGAPVLALAASVRSNSDWARHCYDVNRIPWGQGDEVVVVRWTFGASGSPLVLPPGYSLRLRAEDDLTGLASHTAHVQGYTLKQSPWVASS